MYYKTKREMLETVGTALKMQRTPYEPHWQDVARYAAPYRARFSLADAQRGERKNQEIIDGTTVKALRTLKSGMMAGNTSAARQWLRLTLPDPDLAKWGPVKNWTNDLTDAMLRVLGDSNIYSSFPTLYGDSAAYATGVMSAEEDEEDVLHTRVFMTGTYWLGTDHKGRINTFRREFRMTVWQMIEKWGAEYQGSRKIDWSRFSIHVKNLWDNSRYNEWVDVCHVIMPNVEYDRRSPFSKHKRFSSCYYELGGSSDVGGGYTSADEGRYLEEGGYDLFPILCHRWEATAEDVYGIDCPAMMAIGDTRELQYDAEKLGKAIDKMIDPPLVGPPELQGKEVWGVPGKITYLPEREGQKGLRPIYEVNPRVAELIQAKGEIKRTIEEVFYVDLFRMLAFLDDRERTATEITARQEEKIAQLEPVISQLNYGVLDPLVDLTFAYMMRQPDLIPPPPPELEGQKLKVEYISTMAQALKALGLASTERTINFALTIAQGNPAILDKVQWDEALEEYAERAGAPSRIIVPQDQVNQIRQARAAQQAAAQKMAGIEQMAKGARDLAGADTEGKNALTDVLGALRGKVA